MQPNLQTPRLTLRPFELTDSDDVERLAGDIRVAETTAAIPHPYPKGAASDWIATHKTTFEGKTGVVYAITDTTTGELLGAISLLNMSGSHARCEMGYWIGFSHWRKGICSEAARVLIEYANKELGMTRVVAHCLTRNVGSARVMEKAGFVREGQLVKHVNHRGAFEDVYVYGIALPGR
jgi:RimJ/RimL family protein N-acetyltransferase